MPIYDYDGEKTKTIAIDYRDVEKKFADRTRVVHFGMGDVSICTANSRTNAVDELVFVPQQVAHPIGDEDVADIGKPHDPPVRFLFDKVESIDVLIDQCEKLKAAMLNPSETSTPPVL
jgi:hypothetical protein